MQNPTWVSSKFFNNRSNLVIATSLFLVLISSTNPIYAGGPGTLAKLEAIAKAARLEFWSTNVDNDSCHKATPGTKAANILRSHQSDMNKAQDLIWTKHTDRSGKVDAEKAWHEFTLKIADIVKTPLLKKRKVGNCIHIASSLYADFFKKYKGLYISTVNKTSGLTNVGVGTFGLHVVLLVRCQPGGELYLVDGWKKDGIAAGPVVFDSDKNKFVDAAGSNKGNPPPDFDYESERYAGPTATTGTTPL